MFNIRPEQLIDAIASIVKNDGTHSLRRVTDGRVRSDGALELTFAPNLAYGTLGAEPMSVTLFPARWSMTQYHHVYSFSRTEGRMLQPHRTFIVAYILSPRP